MEAQKKKAAAKGKFWRLASAVLVIFSSLQLIGYLAVWLIAHVLHGISFSVPAASVGVIGGADGPTAVWVTAATGPVWQPVLWLVLLTVGIYGCIKLRGNHRK